MRQPSVPGVPGIRLPDDSIPSLDPLQRAAMAYGALDERLKRVEASVGAIPQLQRDVATLNELLADAKAVLRHALSKGILLVLGGIGGTYGITRVTESKPATEKQVIVKSATTVALEACQGLQLGEARDACLMKVITSATGLPPR